MKKILKYLILYALIFVFFTPVIQACSIYNNVNLSSQNKGHEIENRQEDIAKNADEYTDKEKDIYQNVNIKEETPLETIVEYDYDMPVLNMIGSIDGVSKETKVKIAATYTDKNENLVFDCYATLKVQGSSSASYDKKNFNIQLYKDELCENKNKVKIVNDWGKQSKYCLKANYVDYSQSRNVVSAQLYGQIIKSRENAIEELKNLVNAGAVDGFPIVLTLNNEFYGLYTLNIPKDKWLFNMSGSDTQQAILMGKSWTDSVALKEIIADDFISSGWELEYCSTEDECVDWVLNSFNALIEFVNSSDDETFVENVNNYVDVQHTIDCMLYTSFICAEDNKSKNILWITYDGIKWFPSCYDMDGTWGLVWDGNVGYNPQQNMLPSSLINCNVLWKRIYENFYNKFVQRYQELRQSVLTIENIETLFRNFESQITETTRMLDDEKWPNIPGKTENNIDQIIEFAKTRLETFDEILLKTDN